MKNKDIFVKSIFIYPVKSLGGIELEESNVTEMGLEFDRWWMLVDSNGKFLTQRQIHKLCLFKLIKKPDGFEVQFNKNKILIPFYEKTDELIDVTIWNDNVKAAIMGNEFDRWFTENTGINCRLVRVHDCTNRKTDIEYAKNNELIAFSDAYQTMVLSQPSIDLLNEKLKIKVPVNRFRPNILLGGIKPHLEDEIKNFKISDSEFTPVKPCARCIVPSIDQETSIINDEVILALKKYRLFNGKILFGQNSLIKKKGKIFKNDTITLF